MRGGAQLREMRANERERAGVQPNQRLQKLLCHRRCLLTATNIDPHLPALLAKTLLITPKKLLKQSLKNKVIKFSSSHLFEVYFLGSVPPCLNKNCKLVLFPSPTLSFLQ